jgi:hypothetical protein
MTIAYFSRTAYRSLSTLALIASLVGSVACSGSDGSTNTTAQNSESGEDGTMDTDSTGPGDTAPGDDSSMDDSGDDSTTPNVPGTNQDPGDDTGAGGSPSSDDDSTDEPADTEDPPDTGGDDDFVACMDDQRGQAICPAIYAPVCASTSIEVQCFAPPCPPVTEQVEHSSSCVACADSDVSGYVPGPCAVEE